MKGKINPTGLMIEGWDNKEIEMKRWAKANKEIEMKRWERDNKEMKRWARKAQLARWATADE
jgi:hypothetical protein